MNWSNNSHGICTGAFLDNELTLPRYKPPKLKHDKSNIKNSENTSLFLISCYQYILSGIVLSVGPPFRQRVTENGEMSLSTLSKGANIC